MNLIKHRLSASFTYLQVLLSPIRTILIINDAPLSVLSPTRVGHGQDARSGMFQDKVLILELLAEDTLATSTVMIGEITTLAHEPGNYPVEL